MDEEYTELPKFDELDEKDLIILQRQLNCFRNVTENTTESLPTAGRFCPRVFDGWSCWNETKAGDTATTPCPFMIMGFDPERFAHKECLSDGTWFRHPETNATWSNYTTCVDIEDLATRTTVIKIHQVGYSISICALIISFIIFCSFRSLECTRVRIHKHLFISFIINNFLWLAWYGTVVTDTDVMQNPDSGAWCIPLQINLQYFMVANYFWMFCEGFYLHTLIVFTFARAEGKLIIGFYIFGWLGPTIPVSLYAIFRYLDPVENVRCWIDDSSYTWFISVPVCICLVSSLIFLINILRILLHKLHSDNRRNPNLHARRESGITDPNNQNAIRKAAKATLILVPLLGLQYLLTPFRPDPGSDWELVYEYVSSISMSLQGLCVSILFCFGNGEVRAVLRRRFCPRKSSRGNYSYAPTTTMTMVIRKESENGGQGYSAEACL